MALTDYVIMPSADYQAICDKIREKTSKTDLIKSSDMADNVEDISWTNTNTFDDLALGILTGTVQTIEDSTIMSFRDSYALACCPSLVSVRFDTMTEIKSYSFYEDTNLTTVIIPNATLIGDYAFKKCSSLSSVDFPSVTTVGSNAFENCEGLTTVNIPSATDIKYKAFNYCSALAVIDLPKATSIDGYAFYNCSSLNTVVLRDTSGICALNNTNAFHYTPFGSSGTGGTIYVPQALIESYQAAENWSTLYGYGTCSFVAIEGSEYEEGGVA